MPFPLTLKIESPNFDLLFHTGCLVLLGPNGSGKTQLLRKIKSTIHTLLPQGKDVRYLSAGRIGLFEQYRSDYDGQRGGQPQYEAASFGSKHDATRRHKYETIAGDFQTLSIRTDVLIKVQERLRKLFKRTIFIDWDAGNLKVSFNRNDIEISKYSSAKEASGLIHLVAILTSLYDDGIGALLLDEPEVSLHPQLQSFLMKEIERNAGDIAENKKLIVLATHSTEFVRISSVQDLSHFVFCYSPEKQPIQLSPEQDELKSKKLNELLARIGQEHKLSFFSNRPLLVEGPSDSIICYGLERNLDLFIEAAGVQILPVIGKGQFPVVYKFLKMIGKNPIILTDADSFSDSMDVPLLFIDSEEANKNAVKNGFSNLHEFVKHVYDAFCTLTDEKCSVFQSLLESTIYWKNKKADDDDKKIYRRAFLSLLYTENDDSAFLTDTKIASLKTRIASLFDLLENSGCFILRKGTIEQYYAHSDKETSVGKPFAAVEEVNFFSEKDSIFLNSQYSDIVRCLRYAAQTQEINEVEALKEVLLSVIAPVLGALREGIKQAEINSIINSAIGDRSSLFTVTVDENNWKKISINITSKILDVTCFPFDIEKDDNLIKIIDTKLELK